MLYQGLVDSAFQLEMLKLENCGFTLANGKDLCSTVTSKALDLGDKLGDLGIVEMCPKMLHPSS